MNQRKYKLYVPQWVKILVELKNGLIMHDIQQKLGIYYDTVSRCVQEFERKDYCQRIKKGRTNDIIFSEEGLKLAKICEEMLKFENATL